MATRSGKDIRRAARRGRLPVLAILALSALPWALSILASGGGGDLSASDGLEGSPAAVRERRAMGRTAEEAEAVSRGCLSCHLGIEPMHASPAVRIACVDCHGGDGAAMAPAGSSPGEAAYEEAERAAHVAPRFPERWRGGASGSANPERPYTLSLEESFEFIRFVNPGDLRVAPAACGACHQKQVNQVMKSPMTTSAIFWAAAAYANGILGSKAAILGESYGPDGGARAIKPKTALTAEERRRGGRPFLYPLPRWELVQPGEYFRAFERGGLLNRSFFPEVGNPNPFDEPGRPDIRLSDRGRGTGLRISPALINLQKTRLNDPHLSLMGTNDHPGDFRSGGCTGCHVVYANDRDPTHSGPWARFGNLGTSASDDPTLPRDEPGHPIRHRLSRAIPTSQCMVCHMHQPNSFLNTYLGYTMWDYETDGEALWPKEQRYPTPTERRQGLDHNPEGAAVRGLWGDRNFLAGVSELNPGLEHTQFADYHGHGWVFRAVFKRDRKGNLLDAGGEPVPFDAADRFERAVHLKDIHLEKGMHCVDCHFSRDVHGDGLLHGEYGNALEIGCSDCHGTAAAHTDLKTSGPAAPPAGTDLSLGTTPSGKRRFRWRGGTLYQRSMLEADREWEVVQVKDTLDPSHPRYNPRSSRAKTLRRLPRDGESWGGWPRASGDLLDSGVLGELAHRDDEMTCYSCHSSWITSCFGCHLPQEANQRSKMTRYEGNFTRNYASYNPQVIRTDVYMLGVNGTTLGNKVAPVRSSSALVLSSQNANRQRFYLQQPPISAPGFSSQAFNPHVPHTVRGRETKGCTDCHLSESEDNNAWMAQLLTLGTGWVNFMGRFAWVAEGGKGLEAVAVSEWEEPQAVIGSYLHGLAYPDFFGRHQEGGSELELTHHHPGGGGEVLDVQLRGEYLFTAKGAGGFEVFDVANVGNKDFSERIVTAPVSPLGQRTSVETVYATALALPTTMPMAFDRETGAANGEQPIHPLYRYALISDREEGLVLVDVATLTDGDPANNFLERALAWNPEGVLDGARNLTIAGTWAYVVCDRGLAVVDLAEPLSPRLAAVVGGLSEPTAVQVQFRYAFVTDADGLTVIDVTDPRAPAEVARVGGFGPALGLYVARTYAYVAAGPKGLVIVDVERPREPRIDRVYDGGGKLKDTRDVKIAATNASLFAYVADGDNGLQILQLTSPETVPGFLGFSPRPEPVWIAGRHTHGPAVALSRGLDRDRAVDESGNQVSVFNRIGARPLNLEEMRRLYLKNGEPYRVSDEPTASGTPGEGGKGK